MLHYIAVKGMLLTSAGITNQSLANELTELVGRAPDEVKIGFIPTAAHAESGNKDWFMSQFDALRQYGWSWIDVVDIVDPAVDWRKRLDQLDVVFVSGGNTFYLLNAVRKSGFDNWLRDEAKDKVYVGASAGSIIMTPSIGIAAIPPADSNFLNLDDLTGLGFVDVEIEPHCDSDRYKLIESWAAKNHRHVFAIDDQSAFVFTKNDALRLVGNGKVREYNYL